MSIISDALKKAQAYRLKKNTTENPAGIPSADMNTDQMLAQMLVTEQSKKQKTRKTSRLVSIVLGVILLATSGFALSYFLTSGPEITKETASLKTPAQGKTIPSPKRAPERTVKEITSTNPVLKTKKAASTELPLEEVKSPPAVKEAYYGQDHPSGMPTLSGIMYSPSYPQAIVDGNMVSEGETVRGYTIKKILANKIIVTSNGAEHELKLR